MTRENGSEIHFVGYLVTIIIIKHEKGWTDSPPEGTRQSTGDSISSVYIHIRLIYI